MEVGGQLYAAGKNPGTLGGTAGLDGCGKSRLHRNSTPGLSSQ